MDNFDLGEQKLFEQIDDTNWIELSSAEPIRGEVLTAILTRRSGTNETSTLSPPVPPLSVRLMGARIVGDLNLETMRGTDGGSLPSLFFERCEFEGRIRADHSVLSQLSLNDCEFLSCRDKTNGNPLPSVDLDSARIEGDVTIKNVRGSKNAEFCFFHLRRARVDGNVEFSACKLDTGDLRDGESSLTEDRKYAVYLNDSSIGGALVFDNGSELSGGISLSHCNVGKSVWFLESTFRGKERYAVLASGCGVQGSLILSGISSEYGPTIIEPGKMGGIQLLHAKVGGRIQCTNLNIIAVDHKTGNTILASYIEAGGDIAIIGDYYLNPNKKYKENISGLRIEAKGARVQGDFLAAINCLDGKARINKIKVSNSTIDGRVRLSCRRRMNSPIQGGFGSQLFELENSSIGSGFEFYLAHNAGDFRGAPALKISDCVVSGNATIQGGIENLEIDGLHVTGKIQISLADLSFRRQLTLKNVGAGGELSIRRRAEKGHYFRSSSGPIDATLNDVQVSGSAILKSDFNSVIIANAEFKRGVDLSRSLIGELLSVKNTEIKGDLTLVGLRFGSRNASNSRDNKSPHLFELSDLKISGNIALVRSISSEENSSTPAVYFTKNSIVKSRAFHSECVDGFSVQQVLLFLPESNVRVGVFSYAKSESTGRVYPLDGTVASVYALASELIGTQTDSTNCPKHSVLEYFTLAAAFTWDTETGPSEILPPSTLSELELPASVNPQIVEYLDDGFRCDVLYYEGAHLRRAIAKIDLEGKITVENDYYVERDDADEVNFLEQDSPPDNSLKREDPQQQYDAPFLLPFPSFTDSRAISQWRKAGQNKGEAGDPEVVYSEYAFQPNILEGWIYRDREQTTANLSDINKAFELAPWTANIGNAHVILKNVDCGALQDNDGRSWGEDFTFELEDFNYRSRGSDFEAGAIDDSRTRVRALNRLSWIKRSQRPDRAASSISKFSAIFSWSSQYLPKYDPQPYQSAAEVFRDSGDQNAALIILSEKASVESWKNAGRFIWPFSWLMALVHILYAATFNFGYSISRAFLTISVFIFSGYLGVLTANNLGMLVVEAEIVASGSSNNANLGTEFAGEPCGDNINELAYALDVFIPIVDLRQERRCSIRTNSSNYVKLAALDPGVWVLAKSIYSLSGWILISLTIFTFSRLAMLRQD